ncbi:MAG: polyribonucleotide nucleotidyltransferase [Clostridia bacterium]|nr:polyribonucleotide nucleotidyltransferase [Clostridia bacterium]
MFKKFELDYAGRKLIVETGKMAGLSNGSCLVRYDDTAVLVNVTMSKEPREGIDFLPLSVDYEERLYAVGKIPGGFIKREGKPSEKAVLVSRVIDRPIRPLFPKDYRNDTAINAAAMCVDPDVLPEVPAMIGSAIALNISDIPFNVAVASIKVGLVDGNLVLNPNLEQREKSTLDLTVAATYDKVCMIEAGAHEVDDATMLEAIKLAHSEIKKACKFIDEIKADIGKPKASYKSFEIPEELYNEIKTIIGNKMYDAVCQTDKTVRDEKISKISAEVVETYTKNHSEEEYKKNKSMISETLYKIEKKIVRNLVINENKRPDGRALDEIRQLNAEVGIFARTHGSALFSRGQTQVLSVVTLGTVSEEQTLDGLDEELSKRYIHHYNFPPYSVGEARPTRAPGRREVGHGALAERALETVIPSKEEFPYTIRVVSETLSSNGSTSQGSVCGSTLALMDAGVPIKAPVAGISTGLFTKEDDTTDYIMVTDIQGIEDFFGDMDFKVAGTKKGITAIQVDIKIDGLTYEIIEEAFRRTNIARQYILDEVMLKAIDKPREQLSKYAPKIETISINPEKIRDVIGAGGKVINKIIEETGVKIDIEDNGTVFVSGVEQEKISRAIEIIISLTRDVELNEVYMGKVTKILQFGALVEVLPGKEGLLHISKISSERVNKVEDVLKVGDELLVKVIEINKEEGKFCLSAKNID